MTQAIALSYALHQLATVVWVGGMFFAHMALRPVVSSVLEPPLRLPLMLGVLRRFFRWVWLSIALLWGTGLWIFLGGMGGKAGGHVHLMMAIALVMTALFVYLWFVPFRHLKAAVASTAWPAAGARLARIRQIILTNLILGLITAVAGAAGRFF
ncbi:MAG: CopD family protein [Chromatiaceae bacterium]|jgi:uncharacterized membrane protein|nr:CopD family protein [Chromatiaceae bacterium]